MLAVDGQKVAVTFQLFCGFEVLSLSYIKRNLEGGLIHARLARIKALATAGVGKSIPFRQRTYSWTVGRKTGSRIDLPEPRNVIDGDEMPRSIGTPRIEDRNAKLLEILHVPRDERKTVFKSRRRDHAIRDIEGLSRELPLTLQDAPPFRNGSCD